MGSSLMKPSGPPNAEFMVVGEAPGANEERLGVPFVGESGQELDRLLAEAGLARPEIFCTNVVTTRPPHNDISKWFFTKTEAKKQYITPVNGKYPNAEIQRGLQQLRSEILSVRPKVILALGNTALWALTGQWGITKWRGSLLQAEGMFPQSLSIDNLLAQNAPAYQPIVIPTYHPAAILRQWGWRAIALHDIRYAAHQLKSPIEEPEWSFSIQTDASSTQEILKRLLTQAHRSQSEKSLAIFSCDLETRNGMIACLGIGWSAREALCIPFMSTKGTCWAPTEELAIRKLLRSLLTHPASGVVWQNGLYDLQYFYHEWGWIPNVLDDTMIMQHSAFPGMPKGLDFLASMYCSYRRYWKDEGKNWDPKLPEEQLWRYNCLDCVRTWEIYFALHAILKNQELLNIHRKESLSLYEPVLSMMLRGTRIDQAAQKLMSRELELARKSRNAWLKKVTGRELNPRSPKQLQEFFYKHCGQKPILKRQPNGPSRPTTDKDALARIALQEPLLMPVCRVIEETRSIGIYKSTFVDSVIDEDGRIRTSYNIAGTKTSRFSSSENAFGSGGNLENIPRAGNVRGAFQLPNVRTIFIPDEGYVILDCDLDRADAQVVAWEADDAELKQMFRENIDIHTENAKIVGFSRYSAKVFIHGSNYGGTPRTMAAHCGISVAVAERAQKRWFEAHPKILEWHARVKTQLAKTRTISTAFGRRIFFFDRMDDHLYKEALAWVPQATVAEVTNRALIRIYRELPWVQLLLQNHDSIVMQIPESRLDQLPEVVSRMLIEIPYPDPLTIPIGCKIGRESWGELENVN